jgi:hypothetical protein
VRPRTQYYLGFTVLFAMAAAYLFSLYPQPTTPEYVYEIAPVVAVGLVGLIVEWILRVRRPDLEYFKKRDIARNMEVAWRGLWRGKTAAVHWLAYLGGILGFGAVKWPELQRTAPRLTFLGIVVVLSAAGAYGGSMMIRSPRLAAKGLLIVSSLFVAVAVSVPLFHFDGSEWITTGFHLAYFLLAAAALEASAGLIALNEARRRSGPRPIYTPPNLPSQRWLDDDKGNA